VGKGSVLADRYRLISLLGSGGMAMVWLAEDERLGRKVAVKVPSDVLSADRTFLRRFRREARIAAKLAHPNLVGVYDYSDREERPFLVMQYVEGSTLDQLAGGGEQIVADRLARELLNALEHIHDAGIVHRDVKPSNVMITREGRARLTDFGIAQSEGATRMTQTGQVIGSRGYMAPEVTSGEKATPRSDLYSTGMVLRDHVGPDDEPALRRLVADLTAPDPDSRPASAAEALARLDESRPEPTATAATAPMAPTAPIERRTAKRPPAVPGKAVPGKALVAIAAAAIVLVVVLGLTSGGDEPRDRAQPTVTTPGVAGETTVPDASSDAGDAAEGARLNQQGFQLIQSGQPEEAVPVLQRAVEAFPEGTDDINYAYALFNLGQALRLSGRAEEAIPVLEERLEINNQRAEVEAELAKAREAAED
jgi:predicted Ser/Thr protein kinase